MSDELAVSLREVASLLSQVAEQLKQSNSLREEDLNRRQAGLAEVRNRFSWQDRDKWREEHEERMREIRERADQPRQEQRQFQEQLLPQLRRHNELIARLLERQPA